LHGFGRCKATVRKPEFGILMRWKFVSERLGRTILKLYKRETVTSLSLRIFQEIEQIEHYKYLVHTQETFSGMDK
jgi:hypothetical protein